MGRPFFWRHLPVPAWTIDLELRAAGNSAGSLTPPSCTPQNHSVPLITRCLNLPHVTSQCNVARDWVRYAPFCFCCDSRGRKWGLQHHRFITGPPTPPTKRQNGGLLSYIARWYISSDIMMPYQSTRKQRATSLYDVILHFYSTDKTRERILYRDAVATNICTNTYNRIIATPHPSPFLLPAQAWPTFGIGRLYTQDTFAATRQ